MTLKALTRKIDRERDSAQYGTSVTASGQAAGENIVYGRHISL